MDATKKLVSRTWRHFMHDSLRRNSTLLILSQGINAGAGFIFWVICARLFTVKDIGFATSIISFGLLVSTFTNLGLSNTAVRFLPTAKRRGGLFTASLCSVVAASFFGGVIAVLFIKSFVPKLGFVQASPYLSVLLLLFVMANGVGTLLDGTLMSFRKGEYILGKAIFINIPRIVLPILVVPLAVKGIISSFTVVYLVGISYNLLIILRKLLKNAPLKPTFNEISKHRDFAVANYLGSIFSILPGTLVPIIVLSRLGSEAAAFFYIPMQISLFLSIIPSSTSTAMISESSQPGGAETQAQHFQNAFKHTYSMLVPAVALVILLGWPILHIYGKTYVTNGFWPLVIFACASLFIAINWLGDTWLNVTQRSRDYFLMNAFNAVIVVCSVYLLSSRGLSLAAIGWLVGQVVSAAVYLTIFARSQLFSFIGSLSTAR